MVQVRSGSTLDNDVTPSPSTLSVTAKKGANSKSPFAALMAIASQNIPSVTQKEESQTSLSVPVALASHDLSTQDEAELPQQTLAGRQTLVTTMTTLGQIQNFKESVKTLTSQQNALPSEQSSKPSQNSTKKDLSGLIATANDHGLNITKVSITKAPDFHDVLPSQTQVTTEQTLSSVLPKSGEIPHKVAIALGQTASETEQKTQTSTLKSLLQQTASHDLPSDETLLQSDTPTIQIEARPQESKPEQPLAIAKSLPNVSTPVDPTLAPSVIETPLALTLDTPPLDFQDPQTSQPQIHEEAPSTTVTPIVAPVVTLATLFQQTKSETSTKESIKTELRQTPSSLISSSTQLQQPVMPTLQSLFAPVIAQQSQEVASTIGNAITQQVTQSSESSKDPTQLSQTVATPIHAKQEIEQKIVSAKQTLSNFASSLSQAMEEYKPPMTKLSIAMNPDNLGSVEVTLVQRGATMQISVQSNPQALMMMASNSTDLRQALITTGFQDVQMQFSFGGDAQGEGQRQQRQNEGRKTYQGSSDDLLALDDTMAPDRLDLVIPHYV